MRVKRRGSALIRAAVAIAVAMALLAPTASNARTRQENEPDDEHGSGSARVEIQVDPLRADSSDISQAFSDIRENVASQRVALDLAQQAVTDAETALTAAQQVVAETQVQIDALVLQSDDVVIRAFMSPPAERAMEAMTADNAVDATMKQTMLDVQATADADVLAQLEDAQGRLEDQQEQEQQAADGADAAVDEAQDALNDLEDAVSQQTRFTNEVENRLERDLGEIEALRDTDPALADRLAAAAADLAVQVTAARQQAEDENALVNAGVDPADPNGPTGPITITIEGGLAVVSCPEGLGSISVAGVIARNLQGLLNLAADQGLPMCGDGWRDTAEQVALRKSHCGSSNYAIYQMPASSCHPPTARPGTSMHEKGLAIDFTCGGSGAVRWGDDCHDFLRAHAADFGLYPLSGEPWHWSRDGN